MRNVCVQSFCSVQKYVNNVCVQSFCLVQKSSMAILWIGVCDVCKGRVCTMIVVCRFLQVVFSG